MLNNILQMFRRVLIYLTVFVTKLFTVAILLIVRNISYHLKDTFNFGLFLQLTLIIKLTTTVYQNFFLSFERGGWDRDLSLP